jgi:acid stress-induced BolA-like protein IbaG/YrbA
MVTPQDIQRWISEKLPCDFIEVDGDGQHFEATIVSPEFTGKRSLARHQLVYQALGERMHAQIHALSMKTFSPEEWASR